MIISFHEVPVFFRDKAFKTKITITHKIKVTCLKLLISKGQ